MNFTDAEIQIIPGYCARTWQSCDYWAQGVELFHERTYVRWAPAPFLGHQRTPAEAHWLAGGPGLDSVSQWMPGSGTRKEIGALAQKYAGHSVRSHYAPEDADDYFLAFRDTEKALAFCRTADFDALCLTMEKTT
jgi:hypothetical protein